MYDYCNPAISIRRLSGAHARSVPMSRELLSQTSVFSVDSDVAPLREFCAIVEAHGAWLMVDEAHATGTTALSFPSAAPCVFGGSEES